MHSSDIYVPPLAPVVGLDMDGTMVHYHEHFLRFARQWLGTPDIYPDWAPDYKGEFSEALGLEKHVYRQIKLAYRQGGMKRSMYPNGDIHWLSRQLRLNGIQPWVCTTRPWERLDNIDPDTKENLRRIGMEPYGMIYGEDKYRDLVEIVGAERVLVVVDDLPEQIEKARVLGLMTIMMEGPHNKWWRDENPDQKTVVDCNELVGEISAIHSNYIDEKEGGNA